MVALARLLMQDRCGLGLRDVLAAAPMIFPMALTDAQLLLLQSFYATLGVAQRFPRAAATFTQSFAF